MTRRSLGRFKKIAGISAEGKEEARQAHLDDCLSALLAIAKEPAENQVEKVRELAEQYSGGQQPAAAAKRHRSSGPSGSSATKHEAAEIKKGSDQPETG